MATPILFALDLEPDARLPTDVDKTIDNAGVALRSISEMRSTLEQATGARANVSWYVRMDRHIAALFGDPCAMAERFRSELETAFATGDEIGLHIHSIEKDEHGRWRVNYADPNLIADTVDEAFENFAAFFGRSCRSVRMGDMWTSNACMRQLAAKGVRYDMSIESGLRPQHLTGLYPGTSSKGRRPSQVASPSHPYRPFAGEAGLDEMWALPLSSHPRTDYHHPGMWLISAYTAAMTGFRRLRARDVVRPQVEAAIDAALTANDPPGLCVAVRNYGAAARIEKFFDILCEAAQRRPIQFCTPADYVRLTTAR